MEALKSPQSIGQVLDSGFALYRRSFRLMLVLSLSAAFVGVIPQIPQFLFPAHPLVAAIGGIGMIVAALIRLALQAAMISKLDDVDTGRNQLTITEAFTGGFRSVLPMLGAGILYGIAVVIGCLLLLVPGIWLSISLSMFINAIVLDRVGVIDSLQTSQRLVQGNWWRITAIFSIALILFVALYAGVIALLALVTPITGIVSAATDGGRAALTLGFVLFLLVNAVLTTVLMPLIYAISLVAYRDLQVRKSGGDLAARIAATA